MTKLKWVMSITLFLFALVLVRQRMLFIKYEIGHLEAEVKQLVFEQKTLNIKKAKLLSFFRLHQLAQKHQMQPLNRIDFIDIH